MKRIPNGRYTKEFRVEAVKLVDMLNVKDMVKAHYGASSQDNDLLLICVRRN